MKGTKEFYDMMSDFEEMIEDIVYVGSEIKRESREIQDKGIYYTDGSLDKHFKVFMSGYMLGRVNYMN